MGRLDEEKSPDVELFDSARHTPDAKNKIRQNEITAGFIRI